jgi:hypothetical protein
MKVRDATFLIDYLNVVDATAEYLLANEAEQFVFPVPAYAEVLVGEGNLPDGNVTEAKADLAWGGSLRNGRADGNARWGNCGRDRTDGAVPYRNGRADCCGRTRSGCTSRFGGRDLTHEETRKAIDIEEY